MERLLELIHEYIGLACYYNKVLSDKYKTENLLYHYKKGDIPKTGPLTENGKIRYNFHGLGCRIETEDDIIVDYDYGPYNRCDGFDSWRLHLYAEFHPEKYSELIEIKKLEKGLKKLKKKGLITCPEWQPTPHLCYLSAKAGV